MKQLIKKVTPEFILKFYRKNRKNVKLDSVDENNVECPICNSKFKEFGTFGIVPRRNARCQGCGSLERHRLLWKYLNAKTDLFANKNNLQLLHFAPEKVFYTIFSSGKNIQYYPCDLNPDIYTYEEDNKVQKVDITDIPFKENYFDAILCNHVLEHIPDDALAMSELYRVLKKGGWAILQVPIDYSREYTYEDFSITTPEGREKAFGQDDHVRWYGRDYKDRLARAGFTVMVDEYVKSFTEEEQFRYGFMKDELIYYCKK